MASLPLYMVDFACFNAPQELKVDFHEAHEAALKNWKVMHVWSSSGHAQPLLRTMETPKPLFSQHSMRLLKSLRLRASRAPSTGGSPAISKLLHLQTQTWVLKESERQYIYRILALQHLRVADWLVSLSAALLCRCLSFPGMLVDSAQHKRRWNLLLRYSTSLASAPI